MIITKLSGGLGNQLFQYAIAKSIAKKRNDSFKLDISFYPKQSLRDYELHHFNIKENIASKNEIINFAGNENFFFKLERKVGLKPKRPKTFFEEKNITMFDPDVFNYQDNLYLDGFWQNENYFKNIRSDILEDFSLKSKISEECKNSLYDIKHSNSVSIHIRRGDYIKDKHTFDVHFTCDNRYYEKSIKYIFDNVDKPIFYIFSDDIDWCKNNFSNLKNKVFIDNTKNAIEDLELMKNCKHNIIANSTFSWWGAWANTYKKKIVISPKRWFNKKDWMDLNISCDGWIRI